MNTPSIGKSSPVWRPGRRGVIVTLLVGTAILIIGRGGHFLAREVCREMYTRQLEKDAQWVASRLERRMNTPARQRKPPAAGGDARGSLCHARQRHYQLLLVNSDGHLLAASHALPASVLARVQAQFRGDAAAAVRQPLPDHSALRPASADVKPGAERQCGLAGWNLVMLAPDGGLPSLLMAYRWPVTMGLGAVLAGTLLAVRRAARARRKR